MRSGGGPVGGGRADRTGPELLPDPVGRLLGGEACVPGGVEAELFGDLVAVHQVLGAQGEGGEPGSLETCRVHELVGEPAQVVLVPGGFGQAAGLLPCRAAGEGEREGEGARGLPAAAQFGAELHDQCEQGRPRRSAVEDVAGEAVPDAAGGGQAAGVTVRGWASP